jgi:hypothetical protein
MNSISLDRVEVMCMNEMIQLPSLNVLFSSSPSRCDPCEVTFTGACVRHATYSVTREQNQVMSCDVPLTLL